MKNHIIPALLLFALWSTFSYGQELKLNELEYFETQGVNVLVFSNRYNPIFFDEKTAGIELIHHGVRTVTGGAVRLHNTPEQWDLVPSIIDRQVDKANNTISTTLRYDDFDFNSEPNAIPSWTREPVIGFSQVGYTPAQQKKAVIELDKNDTPASTATLYQITADGKEVKRFSGKANVWGRYLRYNYLTFDFSSVKDPGIYYIEYGGQKTNASPIDKNVYDGLWHTTMDVWLPVQMDHMTVNEGYRVWHGTPYEDDALQAPLNHKHFDGYSMGDTTDTRFKPFERIPGLNVGGWYDAGDFDIQTGSHNTVVMDLVQIFETFAPDRDMTYVDQKTKYTDLHRPDGKNDMLQQVEHGVLALVAQIENIGHPVSGIIVGNLHQYHHLGDAATITDNLPYNPNLKPYESDGLSSGTMDDRWVFTTRSSHMDYSTAASLAAASRVLKDFNPDLSRRALKCAVDMWNDNIDKKQTTERRGFGFGNPNTSAALQLYIATREEKYKKVFEEALWKMLDTPSINTNMPGNVPIANGISYAFAVYPYMDAGFKAKLRPYVLKYKEEVDAVAAQSPYGVPMGGRGWAGNTPIMTWAINNYFVHKYYPDIMDPEYVYRGLNYIFGCHPYSNISFVATIGAKSKKMTYGNNRADFTFIAGGVVPGLLFLQPDFYENKDDWPFLWGENEAIITTATPYIFLSHAVEELARGGSGGGKVPHPGSEALHPGFHGSEALQPGFHGSEALQPGFHADGQ